ncbi:MAG: 50S ribosomal protein L20 [Myxococcales bacterium]|nr:50S ribosomal protein L20 [Myxococcales bacterium]
MRVKRAMIRSKRKKKLFARAKGFRQGRGVLYKSVLEAVRHALQYAYRDRRVRKREFRRLWIVRINAAVRPHGLSYSRFVHALRTAGVELDRKVLAQLALENPGAFAQVVRQVQSAAQAA